MNSTLYQRGDAVINLDHWNRALVGVEVTVTLTNYEHRRYEGTGHVLYVDNECITFARNGDLCDSVTAAWGAIDTIQLGAVRADWIERFGLWVIGAALLLGLVLEGTVLR